MPKLKNEVCQEKSTLLLFGRETNPPGQTMKGRSSSLPGSVVSPQPPLPGFPTFWKHLYPEPLRNQSESPGAVCGQNDQPPFSLPLGGRSERAGRASERLPVACIIPTSRTHTTAHRPWDWPSSVVRTLSSYDPPSPSETGTREASPSTDRSREAVGTVLVHGEAPGLATVGQERLG